MSDRFTRDPRLSPKSREDRELARRLREQMRAAVSNVRAGASAPADRSTERERGPSGEDVEPVVGPVDVHPLH
jgi:hypothetical protein